MRNFEHTGKRNSLRDHDYILHVGRFPGPYHVCNFLRRSVKGFGRGNGSNFTLPIDLRRRLLYTTLSHYRASVYDMNENCLTHFNQKVN